MNLINIANNMFNFEDYILKIKHNNWSNLILINKSNLKKWKDL